MDDVLDAPRSGSEEPLTDRPGATSGIVPVLVTGGAGFIGSHLVDALLRGGDRVTVLDTFETGALDNLGGEDDRLRIVRGSVTDTGLVQELVSSHARVYHLAAVVGVQRVMLDPLKTMMTNVLGTEVVLAAALRHRARVVLASTSEIYGVNPEVPFREDSARVLGPTWTHRWSYSTSKALDEHLAFAYADRGLEVSVVRYFNAYGPRIREDGYGSVVARFASQALRGEPITVHGDGEQTRCFTFVADTVRGTIVAGERSSAVGQAFNIGSPVEVTINQLARAIRECAGSDSEIVHVPYASVFPKGFEDTRRRVPDVSRARTLLGFSAVTDLTEGLRITLDWCRTQYAYPART